jgi:hypothetical protein
VSTLQQLLAMAQREAGEEGQPFIQSILDAEAKAAEARSKGAVDEWGSPSGAHSGDGSPGGVQTLQMRLKSAAQGTYDPGCGDLPNFILPKFEKSIKDVRQHPQSRLKFA